MNTNPSSNIIDEIEIISNLEPEKIAIYYDNLKITYFELNRLIYLVCNYLEQKEIKKGEKIAIFSTNELQTLILFLSLAKLDVTSLVIQSILNIYQINELLEEVSINKILINKTLDKKISNGLKKTSQIDFNINTFLNNKETSVKKFKATNKFPFNITIGSGTTGKPKIMMLSHSNIYYRVLTVHKFENLTKDDILTSIATMDYSSTQIRTLAALCKGASVVIVNKKHISYLNTYKVTNLGAAVIHIESILNYLRYDRNATFKYLKTLILGFSTISSQLRKKVKEQICENLLVGYGANECGAILVASPPDVYNIKGTIGNISEYAQIEIVNSKHKSLPKGNIGLLRVKTPSMIDSYYDNEEATKKHFKDGWFYPGDYVKLTKENQIIYLGRSDDMMNINGINIYPAEVERVIIEHKNVSDVYINFLNYKNNKIIYAIVETIDNLAIKDNDLYEFSKEQLGIKTPHIFVFEKIPRTEQGKIIISEAQTLAKTHLLKAKRKLS